LRSASGTLSPEESKRAKDILQRLSDQNACAALESLVRCGAHKETLLRHLEMLTFPPATNRKALLGVSTKQARNFVATIRHVTGMMERMGGIVFWEPRIFPEREPYLRRRVKEAISDSSPRLQKEWLDGFAKYLRKTPRDFHEQTVLPCLLRDYANALEKYLEKLQTLRNHPVRTSALCQLIWHVKERTLKWHDVEVSDLVAAAEERENNPKAHERWRRQNGGLIKRIGPLEVYPAILPAR